MPELAQLATYRRSTAKKILGIPKRHTYLRRWDAITFDGLFAAWLGAIAVLATLARVKRIDAAATCAYATALVLTGLLMMFVNCFLTELLPRYTLPMFALTFLALVILLSRIAEAFATPPDHSLT